MTVLFVLAHVVFWSILESAHALTPRPDRGSTTEIGRFCSVAEMQYFNSSAATFLACEVNGEGWVKFVNSGALPYVFIFLWRLTVFSYRSIWLKLPDISRLQNLHFSFVASLVTKNNYHRLLTWTAVFFHKLPTWTSFYQLILVPSLMTVPFFYVLSLSFNYNYFDGNKLKGLNTEILYTWKLQLIRNHLYSGRFGLIVITNSTKLSFINETFEKKLFTVFICSREKSPALWQT